VRPRGVDGRPWRVALRRTQVGHVMNLIRIERHLLGQPHCWAHLRSGTAEEPYTVATLHRRCLHGD
jgi:hypothetical protein